MNITQEELKKLVSYNMRTGKMSWRNIKINNRKKKDTFGSYTGNNGGLVAIHGMIRPVHHYVWLYVTGTWPKGQIIHINGDKKDNRFKNLRETLWPDSKNTKLAQTQIIISTKKLKNGPCIYYTVPYKVGRMKYSKSFTSMEAAIKWKKDNNVNWHMDRVVA